MTRREIFFIVSLACLGIFILFGSYLWRDNITYSKEIDFNKDLYTKQAEDLQKVESAAKASQANPVKAQPGNPAGAAANPTASASTGSAVLTPSSTAAAATPGSVQTSPVPPVAVKSNNFIASGSKVGDFVKLGDMEMVVTKSTVRYKVIDITLKGNSSEQPPRLIRTENNRIIYEIPADVDVNVDVTEKITVDKSPLFYGEQKAGK